MEMKDRWFHFESKGAFMRTRIALFSLMALSFLLCAVNASAQEKSAITVKGSELNNGVVIVDVVKDGKTYELQCNQGAPKCAQLKTGKYQMAELPRNYGLYDCRDVQVFSDSEVVGQTHPGQQVGEYCLGEK
jgi:hypothetical protein